MCFALQVHERDVKCLTELLRVLRWYTRRIDSQEGIHHQYGWGLLLPLLAPEGVTMNDEVRSVGKIGLLDGDTPAPKCKHSAASSIPHPTYTRRQHSFGPSCYCICFLHPHAPIIFYHVLRQVLV
jgi:hypothetical protein